MKLSKPQLACLKDASTPRGCEANDAYTPTQKLTEMGLVKRYTRRLSSPVFRITPEGQAALDAISPTHRAAGER